MADENSDGRELNALVVRQWLSEWNEISFDESKYQSKPPEMFLVASVPARTLRRLSDAHRRNPQLDEPRIDDTSIQRQHDRERSDEISRFIRTGYPISSFSERKRESASKTLRKPGWLPTAIVVNILRPGEQRGGLELDATDALHVPDPSGWHRNETLSVGLPESWNDNAWSPSGAYPIEVIDGQHRLWAFSDEDDDELDNYDLPVVAFVGLDFSWQAYLFWTINIKPKKINASLAYDLYPLLRDQDWLEQGEGLNVYRETRAQELTEALWSYPESVWRGRINMLGRTGVRSTQPVTQAAFVRTISETFVRSWSGRGSVIGGLFGGSQDRTGLDWNRPQQAAFLIYTWQSLHSAIRDSSHEWALLLRDEDDQLLEFSEDTAELDFAFASPMSLLASDQGVRGVSHVVNDIMFIAAQQDLGLKQWQSNVEADRITNEILAAQVSSLSRQPFAELVRELAAAMAGFDWRGAKAPGLTQDQLLSKQALRGSGGYSLLRNQVLRHVESESSQKLSSLASWVLERREK